MNAHIGDMLPVNIEAEQALLGAILMRNEVLESIPQSFHVEHYSEKLHRDIHDAIVRGVTVGKIMSAITVRSFMSPDVANQRVGEMTVAQYLSELERNSVVLRGVSGFADAITDCHHRREAMSVGENSSVAGLYAKDELEFIDRIKECRERLTAIITEIEVKNDPQASFQDEVDSTLDQTSEAMSGRAPAGVDPGIPEMVQLTGLWQPGHYNMIVGDVKVGKSSAAWQCFFNIAEKVPAGGVSGEMPVSQIIMREKARRTGISAKRQKLGRVSSIEMDELVRAGADIKRLCKIDICAKQMTLEQIDDRINRLQGEIGIEFYLVDHILNLAWSGKMEDADDFKKANRASAALKEIAMKRNIAITALTHINKTGTGSTWGQRKESYDEKLRAAKRTRPTFKSTLGNVDKNVDNLILVHQAYPAVAALEPEDDSPDHKLWEEAMKEVRGKAEFILALSRENEFPRRKEIEWRGESTSFGPAFNQAQNSRELF